MRGNNMYEKIREVCVNSCFFVQNGDWYRILYTSEEEDKFQCSNEDTGAECEIEFKDIDFIKDKFFELTEVKF